MRVRIEVRRGDGEGGERGGQTGKADLRGADLSMARPTGVRRVCRQGTGEDFDDLSYERETIGESESIGKN